ncbi:MAG: hypothetical protein GY816_14165 [Cytophagales bacterium]|nr:hypothetical protein [Cytophagales bacterium]
MTIKLRTRGNSIRLRLMQEEVKTLEQTAHVQDSVSFPEGERFVYELRITDRFEAVLESTSLSISIPEPDAFRWIQTDEVQLENTFDLPNGDVLALLIEKDYKCLVDCLNENESDTFPNKSKEVC